MEMKQSLILNVLTFDHINTLQTFSFFRKARLGFKPLEIREAPIELVKMLEGSGDKETQTVYTGFEKNEESDFDIAVDLSKSTRFAVHYYRHFLFGYMKKMGYILRNNFVRDIGVWIRHDSLSTEIVSAYHVFGLRVQMKRLSEFPELVIYYDGISRIVNRNIACLSDINEEMFTRKLYRNVIYRREELPEEARYHLEEVFPVVNKMMETLYGRLPANPGENSYKKHKTRLEWFISKALFADDLKAILSFHTGRMMQVSEKIIFQTHSGSNKIQLGLEKKVEVLSPKYNLKAHGPYRLPSKEKQVKFIIIFFETDRELANQLYLFMNGQKIGHHGKAEKDDSGNSLYELVRLRFDLDRTHSLALKSQDDPMTELHKFLDNTSIDTKKCNYVALYLSPISKDDEDEGRLRIYYQLKEILLNHHISSQVIYKEKLCGQNFRKFYMLNIASALLAKAGGIPWRLDCDVTDELVVGIGAYKSNKIGVQYIGSAFSFNNDGEFREFDCVSRDEARLLAYKIKNIVKEYIKKKENIRRLVIHFYKEMSKNEIEPITQGLYDLGFPDLPVIIIHINKTESSNYLAFDTSWEGLMPFSGTIINIAKHEYLLFNNTRYYNAINNNIESWHLPLKLRFQCTKPEEIKNVAVIKELIDQVYQFSRMYYKSVKQQNLPVTLSYPEMVARIFPYFEGDTLPEFAKTNMWFL